MSITIPQGVKPLVDFCTQVVIGAIAFVVVLFVAYLLSLFMKLIAGIGPEWLAVAGEWIEKIVFGLDIACFAMFFVTEVIKFFKAQWAEIRKGA